MTDIESRQVVRKNFIRQEGRFPGIGSVSELKKNANVKAGRKC
jgi:hypothetical protein